MPVRNSWIDKNYKKVIILLIFLSLCFRFINIDSKLLDIHPFRQTQTAITVREFAANGLNFFYYTTPVLGAPYTIPFEFPVYQATAYGIYQLGVKNIDVACRLANIFFYLFSAFLLFLLVNYWFKNPKLTVLTIAFYGFVPFSIFWNRTAMIESCALAFSLAYLLFYIRLTDEDKAGRKIMLWFLYTFTGILACLIKATSALPYIALAGFITIYRTFYPSIHLKRDFSFKNAVDLVVKNRINIFSFLITCIIQVFYLALWTRHCDELKSLSKYGLPVTSQSLHYWNYGTIDQKLSLSKWYWLLWRSIINLLPFFLVVPLFFKATWRNLIRMNGYWTIAILGITILLTNFTFFNLYWRHNYYVNAISPLFAVIAGIIGYAFLPVMRGMKLPVGIGTAALSAVLLFIWLRNPENVQYYKPMMSYNNADLNNNYTLRVVKNIDSLSGKGENIIMTDHDWTSQYLYYADRKGLMLCEDDKVDQMKQNHYDFIVTKYPQRYPKLFSSTETERIFTDKDSIQYYKVIHKD